MSPRFAVLASLLLAVTAIAKDPGSATSPHVVLLKGVLINDTDAHVLAMKVAPNDRAPVHVENVRVLERTDFRKVVLPFIGKPIDQKLIFGLGGAIAQYAKAHDRILTKVELPEKQNANGGILRLIVVVSRYKDVAFRGNRWFSSRLLQEQLGIKAGEEVRLSVLENAINWANTNPFRRLKVILNNVPNQVGEADLLVGVEEHRPLRLATSVDNYGTDLLGKWHYTGIVQFGNLWGLDHQGSYQFVTTNSIHQFQAHVLDYRVPLPWRHFIELSASYVRINATFGNTNQFIQSGESKSADLKYTVPVRNGDNPIEFHAGLDFKQSNNNLEYAGLAKFPKNADTIQAAFGGSLVHHDKVGMWIFGASVNISPGGLDSHNNTETYNAARVGSSPRYIYGDASVQRSLDFGHGWELQSRLIGQVASTNLIGSEELTAGGPTSVRGYKTNVYAGDYGFIFDNDLVSPAITTKLTKIRKSFPPLETRFAIFYDAAQLFYHHRYGFPVDLPMSPLASAGAGLRMNVSNNFSLQFDYGWEITRMPDVYKNTAHGQGHIKVALAY